MVGRSVNVELESFYATEMAGRPSRDQAFAALGVPTIPTPIRWPNRSIRRWRSAAGSGGRFSEDKISGELPAVDSFRSAVKLANEMKVAVVVLDPEDVWKKDWGELYRPVAD